MGALYWWPLTLVVLFPASVIEMITTLLLGPPLRHEVLTAPLSLVLAVRPNVLMTAVIPLVISRRVNIACTR